MNRTFCIFLLIPDQYHLYSLSYPVQSFRVMNCSPGDPVLIGSPRVFDGLSAHLDFIKLISPFDVVLFLVAVIDEFVTI